MPVFNNTYNKAGTISLCINSHDLLLSFRELSTNNKHAVKTKKTDVI